MISLALLALLEFRVACLDMQWMVAVAPPADGADGYLYREAVGR